MDPVKQSAVAACGTCGQPEENHKGRAEDAGTLQVMAALGGACTHFTASDAAVILQKHFAITNNRAPGRRPDGSLGKRLPLHGACGNRHQPGGCPLGTGTTMPGPETAQRGTARAREALGFTRTEAS